MGRARRTQALQMEFQETESSSSSQKTHANAKNNPKARDFKVGYARHPNNEQLEKLQAQYEKHQRKLAKSKALPPTPTNAQQKIIDESQALGDNETMSVVALPGTGKSFTSEMIAKQLSQKGQKCLLVAFNRAIVNETKKKIVHEGLWDEFFADTINAIGNRLIRSSKKGTHMELDKDKYEHITSNIVHDLKLIGKMGILGSTEESLKGLMTLPVGEVIKRRLQLVPLGMALNAKSIQVSHIKRGLAMCFRSGHNAHSKELEFGFQEIANEDKEIFDDYIAINGRKRTAPVISLEHLKKVVQLVLDVGYDTFADKGLLGFQDQLYLVSRLMKNKNTKHMIMPPEQFSWIIVDEAQDLSPVMMDVVDWILKPNGRLIIVGDDKQNIFTKINGSSRNAIKQYCQRREESTGLAAKCFTLTESMRCPQNVTRYNIKPLHPEFGSISKVKGYFGVLSKLSELNSSNTLVLCRFISTMLVLSLHEREKVYISSEDIRKNYHKVANKYSELFKQALGLTLGEFKERPLSYDEYNSSIMPFQKKLLEFQTAARERLSKLEGKQFGIPFGISQWTTLSPYFVITYLAGRERKFEAYCIYTLMRIPFKAGMTAKSFYDTYLDRLECIRYRSVFNSKGRKKPYKFAMTTMHKEKGNEAHNIIIPNPWEVPHVTELSDEESQEYENNLIYVGWTRCTENMFLYEKMASEYMYGNHTVNFKALYADYFKTLQEKCPGLTTSMMFLSKGLGGVIENKETWQNQMVVDSMESHNTPSKHLIQFSEVATEYGKQEIETNDTLSYVREDVSNAEKRKREEQEREEAAELARQEVNKKELETEKEPETPSPKRRRLGSTRRGKSPPRKQTNNTPKIDSFFKSSE